MGEEDANLTCLRESPIIVTYICARDMVNDGADETPSAGFYEFNLDNLGVNNKNHRFQV